MGSIYLNAWHDVMKDTTNHVAVGSVQLTCMYIFNHLNSYGLSDFSSNT